MAANNTENITSDPQTSRRSETSPGGSNVEETGNEEVDYSSGGGGCMTGCRASVFCRYAFLMIMSANRMLIELSDEVGDQFNYWFFHNEYKKQFDDLNVTRDDECGKYLNPKLQALEDKVSHEAARWSLYDDVVSMVPLIFSAVIIGMKSDQIGRRFLFFLPIVSTLISNGLSLVVIWFKIHVGWNLIGSFLAAVAGGDGGINTAVVTIVSDSHGKKKRPAKDEEPASQSTAIQTDNETASETTRLLNPDAKKTEAKRNQQEDQDDQDSDDDNDMDEKREGSRALKIVAVGFLDRLSTSAASFATGYIIDALGFFFSMTIVVSGQFILLVYAFFFIQESGEQKKNVGFMEPLRVVGRAFKNRQKRITLILCFLAFMLGIFGMSDEFEVMGIYEQSPPFCLNAIQLGWVDSERDFVKLLSLPLMGIWRCLNLPEATIAAIGQLSYTVSLLVLAMFRYTWIFFVVPAISIPGALATSMIDTIITRIVGPSALASTFAFLQVGDDVVSFAGSIASNAMYQQFLSTLPTATFYMGAAFFFITVFLLAAVAWRQRSRGEARDSDAARTP